MMNYLESRLLGVQLDEDGRAAVLSLVETGGTKFILKLNGLERLFVSEMRQQNVIENMLHWAKCGSSRALRDAAFELIAGVPEDACPPGLAAVVENALDRVVRGDLELIEITAIYGAQVIGSFASLTLQTED
jgi:hypothetical protein